MTMCMMTFLMKYVSVVFYHVYLSVLVNAYTTSEVLIPEHSSFSRTCFGGQPWCFESSTSQLHEGGCVPLLCSDSDNDIFIWNNETAWAFNITDASAEKHGGWYRCGQDGEELRLDISGTEFVNLRLGDFYEIQCNTSQEAWCFKAPNETLCHPLVKSGHLKHVDIIPKDRSWILMITEAHVYHTGRYRCETQDIFISVSERTTVPLTKIRHALHPESTTPETTGDHDNSGFRRTFNAKTLSTMEGFLLALVYLS